MTEKKTFEERLELVKSMIDKIEKGDLSLEESVTQFEEGMKILNELDQEMDQIQRRITLLQEQGDGNRNEIPLEEKI